MPTTIVNARIFDRTHLMDATHLRIADGIVAEVGQFAWPSLDLPTVRALTAAAHDRDLLVIAHVTSPQGAVQAARAGVDVLAHVPIDPLDDADIAVLRNHDIAVMPTLVAIENFAAPHGAQLATDPTSRRASVPPGHRSCTTPMSAGAHQERLTRPARVTT